MALKTAAISARVDHEVMAQVRSRCFEEDRTVNGLINELLKDWLDNGQTALLIDRAEGLLDRLLDLAGNEKDT